MGKQGDKVLPIGRSAAGPLEASGRCGPGRLEIDEDASRHDVVDVRGAEARRGLRGSPMPVTVIV